MFIKKFFLIVLVALALTISGCKAGLLGGNEPPAPANQPPPPGPVAADGVRTSYADVVEKTSPAVVRIEADHHSKTQPVQFPFGDNDLFRQIPAPKQNQRGPIERGLGSGVLVSADGTILTNYHVVDGAEKITIAMNDNKTFEAKVVGSDQPSDLAVLKIETQNMPFLSLGNSDNVRVGDIVLAIGNPLGIGQSVTAGIISAKGRRTGLSDGSFEDFLQTDAPINRGNSGGALVNLNGELIGINSQILSPGGSQGGNIGIGFSIPSNMAKTVMEQLLKDGKVHRGMLGINIQNISDDIAKGMELKDTTGVLVSNVQAGSAADKAGIKRGDIITDINGEKIEDSNTLRNKVAETAPGTSIKLTIKRDGNPVEITATLDEFSSDASKKDGNEQEDENGNGKQSENGKLGVILQPLNAQIAKQLGLDPGTEGMVVTEIDPSGAAAEAGISRGDVIMEINKQPVNSTADVQAALDKSAGKPVLLLINRRGRTFFATVHPE